MNRFPADPARVRPGRRSVGCLALAACLSVAPAAAERPKVGVAFSGGGAKGCAHIGVLRVLEELLVPVDYAAGTSMGAIVGGLYASGMSLDELERAIVETDWADALIDTPNRAQLVFRRKNDDRNYIPDLEVGIGKGGVKLPTGLRSGQKLNYLLRSLTLPVRTVDDFDRLPIPFRAVATDIGSGQAVVLGRGSLPRALRASMAIPSAFTAVEIDGRLLVDGGLSNNVPVDVVRAMGADVVIAIDIGSPLINTKEVGRSYIKILSQTLGLMTRANMAPQLAGADVVVTPDVGGFGTMAFHRSAEIVAVGEQEAWRIADRFAPYAIPEEEYIAWRESRRREPDPVPIVAAVRVEGNERVDSRLLAAQIRTTPGGPFSHEDASADLQRIFGLGDFETAEVEFVEEPEGTAVVYRVREKPWGPTYLRMGIGFESDLEGVNELSLRAALNRTRINRLGAEWLTEAQLGKRRVLETGFYQPLSFESGWFVEPKARIRRELVPFFDGEEEVAELEVRAEELRFSLGHEFGRYGEARLTIDRSWFEGRRESGVLPPDAEPLESETFDRAGVALGFLVDTLDSGTLPRNGTLFGLSAYRGVEDLGSDDTYTKLELQTDHFRTRGRHTMFVGLDGGVSPDEDLPVYDLFRLGGLFSLSGFESGQLRGDNFGVVRLGYYFQLSRVLYVGGYGEAARVSTEPEELFDDPILTGTGLVVVDSALGPLYLGFGVAEGGHEKIYILFGRQL